MYRSNLEILQALYDSEINVSISWLWDGGVAWKLLLPYNRFSHITHRPSQKP
jgi:hypothetical protein